MTFATPWMLLLLLPLGIAAWRLLRRGRRSGIRFSATSRLPAQTAGWRAKLASLTPFILLAGLALLIVAAARPRTPLAHDKKSIDAIAIAMTVDVSGSMDALDLAPSGTDFRNPSKKLEEWTRLSVVKRLFAEFGFVIRRRAEQNDTAFQRLFRYADRFTVAERTCAAFCRVQFIEIRVIDHADLRFSVFEQTD